MIEKTVSYHNEEVPSNTQFRQQRELWRSHLGHDSGLRKQALELQMALDKYRFTYQFEWLGTPIIRLPDDIIVLQELIFAERPTIIIETGIARGGSLILSASLQSLSGLDPNVVGIDIDIFPHTRAAINGSQFRENIELIEGDSCSPDVRERVKNALQGAEKCLLILDSDHSHAHVFGELGALASLLPVGSLVMVADTVVEEMPVDYYSDRHWGVGNSPLTATREFVASNPDFVLEEKWSRRAIVTEFRDGCLRRVA